MAQATVRAAAYQAVPVFDRNVSAELVPQMKNSPIPQANASSVQTKTGGLQPN